MIISEPRLFFALNKKNELHLNRSCLIFCWSAHPMKLQPHYSCRLADLFAIKYSIQFIVRHRSSVYMYENKGCLHGVLFPLINILSDRRQIRACTDTKFINFHFFFILEKPYLHEFRPEQNFFYAFTLSLIIIIILHFVWDDIIIFFIMLLKSYSYFRQFFLKVLNMGSTVKSTYKTALRYNLT